MKPSLRPSGILALAAAFHLVALAPAATAQVQVRFGDSTRANYSEVNDGLLPGTAAADSLLAMLRTTRAAPLWKRARQATADKRPWNDAQVALTRIAELREAAGRDSAAAWRKAIDAGRLSVPAGQDATDLLPALHAIDLELERAKVGDAAILADLLARIPTGQYDLGDAWEFGRLRAGAADSVAARLLSATDLSLKVRYLTLLSFSTDTVLIPLLARLYVAPDSFGIPPRMAIRASDGLLWIGTRQSMQALLDARAAALARGIYADPRLGHAELDFLGNDSTYVIARTGRWLDYWIEKLRD